MPSIISTPVHFEAPDSEELAPIEEAAIKERDCPDFAPYFDVNTPLPGERSKEWKGYMLDLPEAVYREHPALNISTIKATTPAEWLWSLMRTDSIDPEAAAIGTVSHWAALEQWKFNDWRQHMVLSPTAGLKTHKAQEARLANPGKLVVTAEIVDIAHSCLAAIQGCPEATALLRGEDPEDSRAPKSAVTSEASGFVWDEAFQVWKKWRVDLMPQKLAYILDIKTTRVHPSQWRREAMKMGYVDQAVFYTHCHYLLTGEWRDWAWLVLTKKPPFMCRVVRMRNLKRDDPLYEASLWRESRERLGLDDSLQAGKIPRFVNSAREVQQLRQHMPNLSPKHLRSCFPAYEGESPIFEIL